MGLIKCMVLEHNGSWSDPNNTFIALTLTITQLQSIDTITGRYFFYLCDDCCWSQMIDI